MSFAAGYGKTNVDLLFEGMPRLPLEGEEIFTDKFSLCLGGGVPGTMVTLSRLGVKTKNVTELSSEMFSQFALSEFQKAGCEPKKNVTSDISKVCLQRTPLRYSQSCSIHHLCSCLYISLRVSPCCSDCLHNSCIEHTHLAENSFRWSALLRRDTLRTCRP